MGGALSARVKICDTHKSRHLAIFEGPVVNETLEENGMSSLNMCGIGVLNGNVEE